MQIQVRQFIPPFGHQELRNAEIPDRYKQLYEEMQTAGCELQVEILTTSEVSLTVSDDMEDLDILLIGSGPEEDPDIDWVGERPAVREALCQLLQNAKWRGI
jgi:hypothetical protein